jgi:hypothetical protein
MPEDEIDQSFCFDCRHRAFFEAVDKGEAVTRPKHEEAAKP